MDLRLRRSARGKDDLSRLSDEWSRRAVLALESEFAADDDDRVHVVRSLTTRARVQRSSDSQATVDWAKNCRESLTKLIASGTDSELITFPNQAAFVAEFIAALLQKNAWNRWYFGTFRNLRSRSTGAAIRTVLNDNTDYIPQILCQLGASGVLDELFAEVDEVTLGEIWAAGTGTSALFDAASVRPLFLTAA